MVFNMFINMLHFTRTMFQNLSKKIVLKILFFDFDLAGSIHRKKCFKKSYFFELHSQSVFFQYVDLAGSIGYINNAFLVVYIDPLLSRTIEP